MHYVVVAVKLNNNAIEHCASTLFRVEHGKLLIPSLFPQNIHIMKKIIMNNVVENNKNDCIIY